MIIVTSGNKYIDIDAYATIIAYANLLRLKGINAKAVSSAKLNESITQTLLDLKVGLDEYEKSENDKFIIVDVSNKDFFDDIVNEDKIVEVIDHHTGFEEYRSKGYGSYLLKWCLNKYKDKKIFLNIEELNEEKSDLKIRKKRLDFYLRNGFYLTNIMSKDNKENFHVLSNQKNVDLDEYIELDNFVAKVLNETISDIVEIDLNKINLA